MLAAFRVPARGLVAELTRHEVLANNIANSQTPGFQPDEVVVSGTSSGAPGATTNGPLKTALGTSPNSGPGAPGRILPPIGPVTLPEPEVTGTYTRLEVGGIRRTDNPLDFALRGDGYFVVDTPGGPELTRGGSFMVASDGTLVTPGGYSVAGDGGPITTNAQRIEVTPSGEVLGDGSPIARLAVRAVRPGALLMKTHEGFLRPAGGDADLEPAANYEVHQGYLEDSAVSPVHEMVGMINAFRAYEAGIRSIQASDDMLRTTTDRIGRLV